MPRSDFEPGIYRYYRERKLYFAYDRTIGWTDGFFRISLQPLYSGSEKEYPSCIRYSFFRSDVDIDDSGQAISMFTLVQALPPEKMQILLPGAKILAPNSFRGFCTTVCVYENTQRNLMVKFTYTKELVVPLQGFLNIGFSVFRGAE